MDVRKKLVELLTEYFNIGDSYAYNLTRVKSAFACGTVGLDDFEEFDDETVKDIASYLTDNGVTVRENVEISDELLKQLKNAPITICKEESSIETVQEWIDVKDRLPEEKVNCIVHYKHAYCDNDNYWAIGICFYDGEKFRIDWAYKVTHWMPLPAPPKGE